MGIVIKKEKGKVVIRKEEIRGFRKVADLDTGDEHTLIALDASYEVGYDKEVNVTAKKGLWSSYAILGDKPDSPLGFVVLHSSLKDVQGAVETALKDRLRIVLPIRSEQVGVFLWGKYPDWSTRQFENTFEKRIGEATKDGTYKVEEGFVFPSPNDGCFSVFSTEDGNRKTNCLLLLFGRVKVTPKEDGGISNPVNTEGDLS